MRRSATLTVAWKKIAMTMCGVISRRKNIMYRLYRRSNHCTNLVDQTVISHEYFEVSKIILNIRIWERKRKRKEESAFIEENFWRALSISKGKKRKLNVNDRYLHNNTTTTTTNNEYNNITISTIIITQNGKSKELSKVDET